MTIYALSDPGVSAAKLAMKKLGVPLSPAMCGLALYAPPSSEKTIDTALEAAGLLPIRGEA